jgi:hypothetical protein
MKSTFILILIFCLPLHPFSQNKTNPIKYGDLIKIKLETVIADKKVSSNLIGFELIDLRNDTSSLGYAFTKLPKKINKICFDIASDGAITDWFCNYLKLDKRNKWGDKLVVSLRKLRISNEIATKTFDNGHQGQPQNGWDEGMLLKIEFYLWHDEMYYPLYRYDSLKTIDGSLPNDASQFIADGFTAALSKLFTLDLSFVPGHVRKLSRSDILERNSKENQLPILAAVQYKKGAYKDFDEFKLNSPSIFEFEYKEGKMGDFLYVKEGDKEYPDRTVWGFCDGRNLFINSGDMFAELIKEGNTFYFSGVKSLTRKTRHNLLKASTFNLITNTGEKKTVYTVDNKYYQVDMETGEVY